MFLLKFKIQINVLKENLMCLYVYYCIKMVIDKNVDNNILIKYFIFVIFNREGKWCCYQKMKKKCNLNVNQQVVKWRKWDKIKKWYD